MIGIWNGFYQYKNPKIQKLIGFEKTNFTIEITKFDGVNFEGFVNDDEQTGGMKERGIIVGKIKNNKIIFKKLMPKSSKIINRKGTRVVADKKHSVLNYSGTISDNTTEIKGIWKFNYKFDLLFGFIPILFRPGYGTWEMFFSNYTKDK